METKTGIRLNSAEIGTLWTTYINDSMGICMFKYFLEKVKDNDIRPLIETAIGYSKRHIEEVTGFFTKEGYPIPIGFTAEDVDVTAPELFYDSFYLYYLRYMAKFGLSAYSVALPIMARQDILDFFTECLTESIQLARQLTKVMLDLGLYIKSPYVEISKYVDFINKDSFFAGFLKARRSLTTIEIAHIFSNISINISGKHLITGFAQVAQSDKVKRLLAKGKDIASKNIETLSAILKDDNIPVPMVSDSFVTDSKKAPFSDKLMLFHATVMNAGGYGNYGMAISTSLRHDVQTAYIRLTAEISKYASKCLDLMIESKWLEQPPQAINHDNLIGIK